MTGLAARNICTAACSACVSGVVVAIVFAAHSNHVGDISDNFLPAFLPIGMR